MYISRKKQSTVGEIIDILESMELTLKHLQTISVIFEREWFLCEDRYGACHSVTDQLGLLKNFLKEKMIPLISSGWFDQSEKTPKQFLLEFLKDTISDETKNQPILHTSKSNIQTYLVKVRPIPISVS